MVAVALGFEKKGGKGSHIVFGRNDTQDILTIPKSEWKIPAYQARQLVKMIEKFRVFNERSLYGRSFLER